MTVTKYWEIDCEKHMKSLFHARVNSKHISEKEIKSLIEVLLSKYALSDDEILEQHIAIPFKKRTNYINIIRNQSQLGEPLEISFQAQTADITVVVRLTT